MQRWELICQSGEEAGVGARSHCPATVLKRRVSSVRGEKAAREGKQGGQVILL